MAGRSKGETTFLHRGPSRRSKPSSEGGPARTAIGVSCARFDHKCDHRRCDHRARTYPKTPFSLLERAEATTARCSLKLISRPPQLLIKRLPTDSFDNSEGSRGPLGGARRTGNKIALRIRTLGPSPARMTVRFGRQTPCCPLSGIPLGTKKPDRSPPHRDYLAKPTANTLVFPARGRR
jgi:hypothetical protein